MPKYELIKLIEAQKLNPRTGIPTTDPPITIPFGGILEDITPDRDMDKFVYLGQRYQCAHDILESAISLIEAPAPRPAPAAPPPPTTTAPAPVPGPAAQAVAAAEAPAAAAANPVAAAAFPARSGNLTWELVDSVFPCSRAKLPGGWLIAMNGSITFYPDPGHEWGIGRHQ